MAALFVVPAITISPPLGIALAKSHAFGPNPQTFFGLAIFTGLLIAGFVYTIVTTWPFGADRSKSVE
jgi:cytosine/uracil/thiamine/allantoin permease